LSYLDLIEIKFLCFTPFVIWLQIYCIPRSINYFSKLQNYHSFNWWFLTPNLWMILKSVFSFYIYNNFRNLWIGWKMKSILFSILWNLLFLKILLCDLCIDMINIIPKYHYVKPIIDKVIVYFDYLIKWQKSVKWELCFFSYSINKWSCYLCKNLDLKIVRMEFVRIGTHSLKFQNLCMNQYFFLNFLTIYLEICGKPLKHPENYLQISSN
jgi:hypothetical protein